MTEPEAGMPGQGRSRRRVLGVAHRGASAELPENTLPAFSRAIAQSADAIEADVRLTADGHALLLHDPTVDRTTSGTGALARMTVSRARSLDAGGGARIPTIAELLALARGRVYVLLEIKDPAAVVPALEAVTAAEMDEQVALMAFRSEPLRRARGLAPRVACVRLSASRAAVALRSRLPSHEPALGPWHRLVDARLVGRCHARGRAVVAWTADEERDLRRLVECGVDAVVTNRPARLARILRES